MDDDEQAIRRLIARWHEATAAGEVGAVLELMTNDAVFLVPNRPAMRGRAEFELGLRGLLREHRIESSSDIEEIVVSGDLAYCWSDLDVTIVPRDGGHPLAHKAHALTVLRKGQDGRWRLARDANLPLER